MAASNLTIQEARGVEGLNLARSDTQVLHHIDLVTDPANADTTTQLHVPQQPPPPGARKKSLGLPLLKSRDPTLTVFLNDTSCAVPDSVMLHVRQLCTYGLPESKRARIWYLLVTRLAHDQPCSPEGNQLSSSYEAIAASYKAITQLPLFEQSREKWQKQVQMDLKRSSAATNIWTEDDARFAESENVIYAFCTFFPEHGYLQSMSEIAAFLVTVCQEDTAPAFWIMTCVCNDSRLLKGYFSQGLRAYKADCGWFERLLRLNAPTCHALIEAIGIPPTAYVTELFQCVFIRALPLPLVYRVWDMFLCEGKAILIVVAITLVRMVFAKMGIRLSAKPKEAEMERRLQELDEAELQTGLKCPKSILEPIDLDHFMREIRSVRNQILPQYAALQTNTSLDSPSSSPLSSVNRSISSGDSASSSSAWDVVARLTSRPKKETPVLESSPETGSIQLHHHSDLAKSWHGEHSTSEDDGEGNFSGRWRRLIKSIKRKTSRGTASYDFNENSTHTPPDRLSTMVDNRAFATIPEH